MEDKRYLVVKSGGLMSLEAALRTNNLQEALWFVEENLGECEGCLALIDSQEVPKHFSSLLRKFLKGGDQEESTQPDSCCGLYDEIDGGCE
jgi:hypothetical protein